jgi:hypothetical protein
MGITLFIYLYSKSRGVQFSPVQARREHCEPTGLEVGQALALE